MVFRDARLETGEGFWDRALLCNTHIATSSLALKAGGRCACGGRLGVSERGDLTVSSSGSNWTDPLPVLSLFILGSTNWVSSVSTMPLLAGTVLGAWVDSPYLPAVFSESL